MSDHINFDFHPNNRSSFYHVSIFQSAYDEICIALKNGCFSPAMGSVLFVFPVKTAPGCVAKINKTSVGTDDGKAESLINKLIRDDLCGPAFARAMVQQLVFNNPAKNKTLGL